MKKSLSKNTFFSQCICATQTDGTALTDAIIMAMSRHEFKLNERIWNEGDKADSICIVEKGEFIALASSASDFHIGVTFESEEGENSVVRRSSTDKQEIVKDGSGHECAKQNGNEIKTSAEPNTMRNQKPSTPMLLKGGSLGSLLNGCISSFPLEGFDYQRYIEQEQKEQNETKKEAAPQCTKDIPSDQCGRSHGKCT